MGFEKQRKLLYIYYNYLFSIILQVQGIGVKTN